MSAPVPCVDSGRVAFVFSGLGGQWPAMGAALLERFPAARDAMQQCDAALCRHGVAPVLELLRSPERGGELRRTDRAQAALFTLQVGLVAQWRAWTVEPDAVVGFSLGEVAAAWAAGIHDLSDAAWIVAACGRGARAVPPRGRMLACALDEPEAVRIAEGRAHVAAVNGPQSTVLSGDAEAIDTIDRELARSGIWSRVLDVVHPFHCVGMARAGAVMQRELAGLSPAPPRIPLLSTVTGGDRAGAYDATYWGRAVQAPVRFEATVRRLSARGVSTFVQLGAHPDLERPLRASAADTAVTLLRSLRRGHAADATLCAAERRLHALRSTTRTTVPRLAS